MSRNVFCNGYGHPRGGNLQEHPVIVKNMRSRGVFVRKFNRVIQNK